MVFLRSFALDIELDAARGRHVLVALSGGADSVALLILLCRARDAGILTLSAAHFEHGIRGEESIKDAEFCRALCQRLDVRFILGRAPVPEIARRTGEGVETCARRLRHDFLKETANIMGAELIALAHHMDDQAETVLMHLLRGTGPEGIAGMRALSGRLFRPLIGVRKKEIIDFLCKLDQPWREDATNKHEDNPRNILRLRAIPELERAYPGTVSALARYARVAARESDFLGKMTDDFVEKYVETLPLGWRIRCADDGAEVLLRRALRRLLGRDLGSEKLDELIALKGSCDVFDGISARRVGEYLYIVRLFDPPSAATFASEGTTCLEGICCLVSAPCAAVAEKALKSTQVLDRKSLEGAVLRTRRAGDRIAPLGMKGSKSLSDYFTDLKIDPPLRDIVPLLAKDNEILWAVGFGISRYCALRGEEALRIECRYTRWGGFAP